MNKFPGTTPEGGVEVISHCILHDGLILIVCVQSVPGAARVARVHASGCCCMQHGALKGSLPFPWCRRCSAASTLHSVRSCSV
jgi:hypothetical protein